MHHPAVLAVCHHLASTPLACSDYRYLTTFLDDRSRYADIPDELIWCVVVFICSGLSAASLRKLDESLDTQQQRVAAIVDAGALELAAAIAVANIGRRDFAAAAACMLLKTLTRYGVADAATLQRCATPEVNAVDAMICVATTCCSAADLRMRVSQDVVFPGMLSMAYDALLGAAGAPPYGPPHKLTAAMPQSQCAAALHAADLGKLHDFVVSQAIWATQMLHDGLQNDTALTARFWRLLRSTGRVYRWLWTGAMVLNIGTEMEDNMMYSWQFVSTAMISDPHNAILQNWGLTYVFLPMLHLLLQSGDVGDPEFLQRALGFCRGRCCIDMRAERHPLTFMAIGQLDGWKVATSAARLHTSCLRPAARLISWAAVQSPDAQRELNALGAPDVLRGAARRSAPQRTRRGAALCTPPADTIVDEEEEVGSDGERLSEWGDDDGPPPDMAGEASTQALVARALRAIAGETAATVAERAAAAAAAADAAAAALLAELEGEKDVAAVAAARKKSKSKKKKSAKHSSQASDTAAAACGGGVDDAQDDGAHLLNVQQAALPPSAAAAAAEALFPWLSLADAPGGTPTGAAPAPPAVPEDTPHEDDHLCVICLDAPRDTLLAGCADTHPAALCADCARRLLAAGGAQPAVCPLCRAPATPL